MSVTWTIEQILALAPDVRTRNASHRLLKPEAWQEMGATTTVAWGIVASPREQLRYQSQIDLTVPAFRCTCNSRHRPCEHALALFIRATEQPTTLATPPDWVTQPQDSDIYVANARSQQERQQERHAKVCAGMVELGIWLADLLRNGLADVRQMPNSFWDEAADRLVDAEAEMVARQVRDLSSLPASGKPDWPEKLLTKLGRLQLLVEGYQRFDSLPTETQADLKTAVGWLPDPADLASQPRWRDQWVVMGRHTQKEKELQIQRTWLWSQKHQRPALIRDYAVGPQKLDNSLLPGQVIDADLAYYPSAAPLRAAVVENHTAPTSLSRVAGYPSIPQAHGYYARALAANPWLNNYPLALLRVTPWQRGGNWFVRDEANHALPLVPGFEQGWHLQALSGGRPLALFGEWNGEHLRPLTVAAEGRWLQLALLKGVAG